MPPMRRVLRGKSTGKFFTNGNWIEEIDKATDFSLLREVLEACFEHKITNAEVLLSFGDSRLDVVIPVSNGHGR